MALLFAAYFLYIENGAITCHQHEKIAKSVKTPPAQGKDLAIFQTKVNILLQ